MDLRRPTAVTLAAALAAAPGCAELEEDPGGACLSTEFSVSVSVLPAPRLDMLVILDDSPSMADERQTFLDRFPAVLRDLLVESDPDGDTCPEHDVLEDLHLAAALRALTTQADDDACNEGFRRPDVPLALIFLADENDGSLDPTHPELLDPDRADLGPLSIRSALHPELLRDVAELAAGFRALTVSFPSLVPPICVHLCPSVVSPLPLPLLSPTPFATTRSPMPAATLLNRIRRARRDGPTLAVIRHAARHEIAAADMEEAYRTPLTDAGRSASAALGALLPSDLRLVCFHSPVPRCADTAALVAEGFRAAGGTARDGGDLDALGAEYVRDASVVLRSFAARGRRPFVRDWCTGALGPDLIQEPCAAGRHVLQTLLDLRSAAPADELHLHVTHDLTLITLLALISDPTAPRFPWPPFLDGVVLSLQADRVIWRRTSRVIATDRDGRRRD